MADWKFHRECLKEIRAQIINLGLGIDAGEVKVRRQALRKAGDGTLTPHRGITIHPEKEVQNAGTNRSEDIGYGCGITIYLGADHSSEDMGIATDVREAIRQKFINRRLTNVQPKNGHVCINTVEHGDFANDLDKHKYEVGTLLIRVWARETRS